MTMETKITQKHICSIFLRCTLKNIKANDLFFLPVLLLSYPLKFASHVTNYKPLKGMLQNHCRHLQKKNYINVCYVHFKSIKVAAI